MPVRTAPFARALFVSALALGGLTQACAPAASAHPEPATPTAESYRPAYVVGGRVRGLEGIGLSLRDADGRLLQVDDDGRFAFGTRLEDGTPYAVEIAREPISPVQSCVIVNGKGTISGANAVSVEVVCTTLRVDDEDLRAATAEEAAVDVRQASR
ncbi:MAG: hypothetical protein KC657_24865 [Myxococcales bacterium]|nr:hypothetical protein [Myxococcales bacterium]